MTMRSTLCILSILLFTVSCATAAAPEAARIDRFVQRAMTEFPEVPSLGVAIVRDGKPLLVRSYGMRDLEKKLPATEETVYYIASSTKSYVGLLTSILAARGVVDLDAPITKYLPELRFGSGIDADTITLRALLTHTAAIDNDAIVMRTAFSAQHTPKGLVELLGRSKSREAKFQYDNLGYVAASLVLERVTGKPWQELLATELFAPLGMTRTTAYMSRTAGWPVATPYDADRDLNLRPVKMVKNDMTMHAAGGLVTTPRDLARWLEANVNAGRVGGRQAIPAAAVAEAHRQQTKTPETNWYLFRRTGYALGWYHSDYEGALLMHHFGGYEGWRAHVSFMPEPRHGVAIVTNTGGPGAQLRDVIAAYTYDVLLGKPDLDTRYTERLAKLREETKQSIDRAKASLASRKQRPPSLSKAKTAYAGTYTSDLFGTLEIRLAGDQLHASLGQLDSILEPFTEPESARVELIPGTGEVLRFVFDDAEKATSVKWRDEVFRRQ